MPKYFSTLALTLVIAVSACGGSGTEPQNVAGVYTLETVNGSALPVVLVNDGNFKREVISGGCTLRADGTFDITTTFRDTNPVGQTDDVENGTGSYSQSGSQVMLHYSDGSTDTLIAGSGTLTLSVTGIVLVYRM